MKAPAKTPAKRAPKRRPAASPGADDSVPASGARLTQTVMGVEVDIDSTDQQLVKTPAVVERQTSLVATLVATVVATGSSGLDRMAAHGGGYEDHADPSVALARLKEQYAALVQIRAAEGDELKRVKKKYARLKQKIETLRAEHAAQAALGMAPADELKRVKKKYARLKQTIETLRAEHAAQAALGMAPATANTHAKAQPLPRRLLPRQLLLRRLLAMARHLPLIRFFQQRALLQRQQRAVHTSGLFDKDWYLAAYPDVAAAGLDPAVHYLQKGWLETRDPGPDFNTSGYLKANPDVARVGTNPLLHYIEHGREEGRAIGVASAPRVQRVTEVFAPPAPCVQFPAPEPEALRWRRSAVLARLGNGRIELGGQTIGCAISAALAGVLQRFGALTGLDTALPFDVSDTGMQPLPALRDAWFVRDNMLRLHWNLPSGSRCVVRCLQWQSGQQLSLAGEGLMRCGPAFLDLELVSPYKPLLILFATPDGRLVGGDVLAFPSLARGGLHHGELASSAAVAASGNSKSLSACSRDFEARLLALLAGQRRPLLRAIRIALDGADGTGPLFQPAVQAWLAQVMHIGFAAPAPPAEREPAVARFLIEQASPPTPPRLGAVRGEATATLALPHDCCPSLEILLADAAAPDNAGSGSPMPLSLVCATSDPNRPYVLASLPPGTAAALLGGVAQSDPGWPCVDRGEAGHQALLGAIRTSRSRPLADIELLEPTAQHGLPVSGPRPAGTITVVVEPATWDQDAFAAALASLASQSCANQLALCCIGRPNPAAEAAIARLLGRSLIVVSSWADAAQAITDGYVLHLGAGIILHDRRTIAHLALLAGRETVAGASCAILAPSRRGREWVHGIHDAGMVMDVMGLADLTPVAANFWNMVMPLAQLPLGLWLTRRDRLAGRSEDSRHILLLSTRVTASRFADLPGQPMALKPPFADAEQALRISECVA